MVRRINFWRNRLSNQVSIEVARVVSALKNPRMRNPSLSPARIQFRPSKQSFETPSASQWSFRSLNGRHKKTPNTSRPDPTGIAEHHWCAIPIDFPALSNSISLGTLGLYHPPVSSPYVPKEAGFHRYRSTSAFLQVPRLERESHTFFHSHRLETTSILMHRTQRDPARGRAPQSSHSGRRRTTSRSRSMRQTWGGPRRGNRRVRMNESLLGGLRTGE